MVRVTNVNEAPVITTKSRTGFTQRENATSALHTYRATDPDRDDAITWSVEGSDRDDFAIYDGILTFRLLPDHEIPADSNGDNEYEITVVASDSGNLRDTVEAIITITEVNEGPEITPTQYEYPAHHPGIHRPNPGSAEPNTGNLLRDRPGGRRRNPLESLGQRRRRLHYQ